MIRTTLVIFSLFATAAFSSVEKPTWDGNLPTCESEKYAIFFNHQELSSDEILSSMGELTWNSLFEPIGFPRFLSGLPFIIVEAQVRNPDNLEWDELKLVIESILSFLKDKKGISLECQAGIRQ